MGDDIFLSLRRVLPVLYPWHRRPVAPSPGPDQLGTIGTEVTMNISPRWMWCTLLLIGGFFAALAVPLLTLGLLGLRPAT